MKLIYPAIFHREDGSYWVEFPDLSGCQTFGDTVNETYEFAKEALSAYCVTLLESNRALPAPTSIETIKADADCFVTLVETSTTLKDKSIKKTLTIPSWLNEKAVSNNINFSQVLQDALIDRLGL